MDEKNTQEFSLEDILKEFGAEPGCDDAPEAAEEIPEEVIEETPEETVEEAPEEVPEKTPQSAVTGDTIRLDVIRPEAVKNAKAQVHNAQPIEDEVKTVDPFTASWEPDYDQPMGEYIPPQPIVFHPRSRLRELKRKLVAGPEKIYYAMMEKGLSKLQSAIFISFLVVLLTAGSTVMYALGMVQENRIRLMVFGQFLAMLISALLGYGQLITGLTDIFKKRFRLESMLLITFIVCCVDGVLCLQQQRIPCCAAFSLQVLMSLWNTYQKRSALMGQMDTMRKANHLDSVVLQPEYYQDANGFVRAEGQVEDFMDTYKTVGKPEKRLWLYGLVAMCVCFAIGITAGIFNGVSDGIHVAAVSLLAAMPATAFITVSRPFAILERRLHSLGTVLCGWQGIEALCSKAVFPLEHSDLFPSGTIKMNGVKFYGSRLPDQIMAYAAAVIEADGSGIAPLFTQLLESRNGRHYPVEALQAYDNGGIGATVEEEAVLVGSLSFLKDMGVEIPEGIRVSHAVCVAIDGEFAGLFALSYERDRSSAAGLSTLCNYRGLKPLLLAGDFMLTGGFLRGKFGINPKKVELPEQQVRQALKEQTPVENPQPLVLVTTEGLAPFAYGVTGARALRTACNLGVIVHMIGGILGMAVMLALTLLGALQLLTPANMFLYQMVWLIPAILITEWTRSV